MAIKYISIVLGTIFEIYCINMFTNIYLPRKEIEKYKYYLIFILISIFYISKSFLLNGISMAIASLIAKFLFTQLYESKQYVKMIISISHPNCFLAVFLCLFLEIIIWRSILLRKHMQLVLYYQNFLYS